MVALGGFHLSGLVCVVNHRHLKGSHLPLVEDPCHESLFNHPRLGGIIATVGPLTSAFGYLTDAAFLAFAEPSFSYSFYHLSRYLLTSDAAIVAHQGCFCTSFSFQPCTCATAPLVASLAHASMLHVDGPAPSLAPPQLTSSM